MTDIVEELRDASSGHPDAVIPWPHRVLHEAADEIERLRQTVSELRGVIAASRRREEISSARITELHGFLNTANEQAGALENENGELRGIIQQAADDVVAASYPRTMYLEWLEAARKVLAKDD